MKEFASRSARTDTATARLSTRLAFFAAGFALACWAPLVPYAKVRVGVDDGGLGLLLMCLGVGSVLAMVATGPLSARYGSRPIIVVTGLILAAMLPLLAIAPNTVSLGFSLLLFGGALGSLDIAMNIHAVEVERDAGIPLMSGFHGLFSVGGFLGAAAMTALLSAGASVTASAGLAAACVLITILVSWPRLLRKTARNDGPRFVAPHGYVLWLGAVAFVLFLVEGALLDWGALLMTERRMLDVAHAGLGYMVFSIAMTVARLTGDAVTATLGDFRTFFGGVCVAVLGFLVLLLTSVRSVALGGFVLIGLGAANLVPMLFRRAGRQTAMPTELAVAAVTTCGYAGTLLGPSAIGFAAKATTLQTAFWVLTCLVALILASTGWIVPRQASNKR